MDTAINSMGGGGAVVNNINNYYTEVTEATGFVDPSASTLAFNDGTREFSISPVGESFVFYAFGTRYEKTAADSIVIADTTGQWYISYDSNGDLVASQTIWDLGTQVPVGSVYWTGAAGTIDSEPAVAKNDKFSNLYVISVSSPGTLTDSQVVLFHAIVGGESIELPKKLFYSQIKCGTAPTSDATFDILVNGTSKGSATILAGQTSGTFTFNSKVSLNDGDIVKITGPASADSTLEDIAITLRGERK